MKQYTIIHFSQDFARGKPQLGGFTRIFNICTDTHAHIIFTLSARIKKVEKYQIGLIQVIEIPMRKMPMSKKMQFFEYRNIAKEINSYLEINKIEPDLLFGHSQILNFYILKELRKKFFPRIKILWEANVIWGIRQFSNLKAKISNRLNWMFQRSIFRQADGIICQTNSSRDFITKTFGVDVNKCSVITNAILPETDKMHDIKINKPKKILCLGLFDEMNGIPFLVDFVRNEKNDHEVEFHFIGHGPYRAIVEKLNADGLCRYWGKLSHSEMQKKYPEFDFVIIPRLPRIEADLFIPTKLLEGMSAGVIPICSDVNGMSEVIINGNNGFLFKAGNFKDLKETIDKVKELNLEVIRKITCNARATVLEHYNWHNKHQELATIYREFIAR